MACFIVPATEAVITTTITKVIESKEGKSTDSTPKVHFSSKLRRLNSFLWGGSALLAFEHLWHGEITPFFPFITAAGNEFDAAAMLHEMSTVGVSMAVLVTVAWGVITIAERVIAGRDKEVTSE